MAQKRKKGLVIVESPAKAKKIGGFLGKDYEVRASMGHVRDLPASAKEVPASIKKEPWSTLGVNTTADFEPVYVVPPEKKKVVKELKDALKDADELILATDEDREGESIGWHLAELLKPKVPVKRMVFSEITRKAILDALHHPRELDRNLVEAQEAVGFSTGCMATPSVRCCGRRSPVVCPPVACRAWPCESSCVASWSGWPFAAVPTGISRPRSPRHPARDSVRNW